MRVLLVVGSAPCLYEDRQNALSLYPEAHCLLVNGACVAIEQAEHVLAGHTDKAEEFAAARRRVFPLAKPWALHASHGANGPLGRLYPSVTHWWGPEVNKGAASAAKAAAIGLLIGYDRIVLCGAPMDGSGYFPGESMNGGVIRHNCARIGDPTRQEHTAVEKYRRKFLALAETEFRGKVFSMSGFTRDCLGAPT